MENKYFEEALKYVNLAREAFGLPVIDKLPYGTPRDSVRCPIRKSLADIGVEEVTRDFVVASSQNEALKLSKAWGTSCFPPASMPYGGKAVVQLPEELRKFVWEYDGISDDEFDLLY